MKKFTCTLNNIYAIWKQWEKCLHINFLLTFFISSLDLLSVQSIGMSWKNTTAVKSFDILIDTKHVCKLSDCTCKLLQRNLLSRTMTLKIVTVQIIISEIISLQNLLTWLRTTEIVHIIVYYESAVKNSHNMFVVWNQDTYIYGCS